VHSEGQIVRELDAMATMARKQLWKLVFKNRNAAFAEHFDLGFVVIHADDRVAHLCKADGGNQANIP
jgi:hypothetical protein